MHVVMVLAAKAGLSANDVIIAIDGLKATMKLIEKYAKQEGTYTHSGIPP